MSGIQMDGTFHGRMPADYLWRVMMLAGVGFWQIRLDANEGPTIAVNNEFPALLGRTREQFPTDYGEYVETFVHPDDRHIAAGVLSGLRPEASSFDFEHRLFSARDKDWRWFRVQGDVGEFDDAGAPSLVFGCAVDVHEARVARRKIEEQARKLHEEQNRVDAIIDAGGLMVWEWNLVTDEARVFNSLHHGDKGKRLIEGSAADIWGSVLPPEEWRRILNAKDSAVRGEVPFYDVEYRAPRADGGWMWWYDRGRVVKCDATGRPTLLMGVTIDVTRQKETDFKLEESLLRGERLEESVDIGIWRWDLATDAIEVNNVYLRRLGYDQGNFPAPTMSAWAEKLCAPDDRQRVADIFAGMIDGGRDRGQCVLRMRRLDGALVWVHAVAEVRDRDAAGRATLIAGYQTDITDRKRMEEQQAEALKTIIRQKEELQRELEERTILVEDIGNGVEALIGPGDPVADPEGEAARRGLREMRQAMKDGVFGPEHAREYVTRALSLVNGEREKLRANEEGRERDRRLWADMLSACPVALSISSDNIVRYASPVAREKLGLRPGDHYEKILDRDQLSRLRRELDASPDHKVEWTPVHFKMPDGSRLDGILSVIDTVYEGKPASAAWTIDIAGMERVDQRLRLMLDSVPLAVTFWDEKTRPIDCNAYVLDQFKLPDRESYLERFYELSPPYQPNGRNSAELAREYIEQAMRAGQAEFRWLHCRSDGTPLPCEISLRAMTYEGHRVVVGVCRDIREIITRRAQVAQAHERMRNLIDAMPFAAVLFDGEGKLTDGNTAATALFGLGGRDELIARHGELSPSRQPDGRPSRSAMKSWLDIARREGGAELRWRHRRTNGTALPVRIVLRALSDREDSEVIAFLSLDTDEGSSVAPLRPATDPAK